MPAPKVSIDTLQKNLLADRFFRERPDISISLRKQWQTGKRKGHAITAEHRAKMVAGIQALPSERRSDASRRAWQTRVKKGTAVSGVKGKHFHLSPATRLQMSLARRGAKGSNWRGGLTNINKAIRKGVEWKLWREAVFARDNYTCQFCGVRGGVELHPDHIKPFSQFPELRYEVSNGRTLCAPCHRKTPTYGWRVVNQFSHHAA